MTGLRTADYEFDLPPELVAQSPPLTRGESRMMIVERASGTIRHARFADVPSLIPAGDVIVLNTTRVLRARLLGTRESGTPAEILLLRHLGEQRWEAMVHPGGKLKPGRRVHIADGFDVHIDAVTDRRTRIVTLETTIPQLAAIEQCGHIPLPPYIHRPDEPADAERYQTVYAREVGSVAAPTAGLHFTPELLGTLASSRVRRADVLLHVGAGTFKPVEVDDPAAHVMHEEWCEITPASASTIAAARADGGRVWAVGTTAVRTLETMATADGTVTAGARDTRIFIRPPYTWRVVNHLITNFHLPRSTLIMLVAAFAGYELTMEAYRTAVRERYRFFSYGDAMCIL